MSFAAYPVTIPLKWYFAVTLIIEEIVGIQPIAARKSNDLTTQARFQPIDNSLKIAISICLPLETHGGNG
jgi:hypothetical protein